ncbi:MAG TPA: membrane protein insertion efficiency factor YidD [bacterium]|nr:membrane protein insertion efficiency factor YidD [bacterium]
MLAKLIIKLYRVTLSPFLGGACRYYPSCSHYAELSYARYGFVKGTARSLLRIMRCHPWAAGGIDLP